MDKAANQIQGSTKLKFIIVYLAIITTIAVFTVGYNQHVTCETQKANVEASLLRNEALDKTIGTQVHLYKVVDNFPLISAELDKSLNQSIKTLIVSRDIIKDTPPVAVKCFAVG